MAESSQVRGVPRVAGDICALSLLITVGATTVGIAPTASAHMGSKKNVRAVLVTDGVEATFEVEAIDASLAVGLGLELQSDALRERAPLVTRWLTRGVTVTAAGQPCTPKAETPRLLRRNDTDVVVLTIAYRCTSDGPYVLRDDTVFDEDPDHATVVEVVSGDTHGVHVLTAQQRSIALIAAPSTGETVTEMVAQGAIHLVTGYDHLLFLLTLLLAGGMVAKKRGLRVAGRDIAWVVTAFTIGHSVSLAAATFDLVVVPSRVVESAIAATIIIVAMDNVLRPDRSSVRPWLAGVFGLIHGFGFASVLGDVGVPASERALALLSFNVGIELAQLAFVVVTLAPVAWLANEERFYRPIVLRGGSAAIACMGLVWLVERAVLGA
jgi:hypothetical protein